MRKIVSLATPDASSFNEFINYAKRIFALAAPYRIVQTSCRKVDAE
jgi:hypothetical protein